MCDFANGIVLFRRALPFCPSERQVIYVESDYEKDVNDFIHIRSYIYSIYWCI